MMMDQRQCRIVNQSNTNQSTQSIVAAPSSCSEAKLRVRSRMLQWQILSCRETPYVTESPPYEHKTICNLSTQTKSQNRWFCIFFIPRHLAYKMSKRSSALKLFSGTEDKFSKSCAGVKDTPDSILIVLDRQIVFMFVLLFVIFWDCPPF